MRILHIHTTMRSGGVEAVICGLANEMCNIHDVTVCTIFEPSDNDVFYKKLNPAIGKLSLGKKNVGFSIKEIFKIYSLIRNGKYDVVNIHGCFQYYFLAILLLYKRTKFFYTIHTDAYMENFSWDRYLIAVKRLFFQKRLMHAVTISHSSQKSFEKLYGCESYLIYNGIKRPNICGNDILSNFKLSDKTKIFIHPGRITLAKNQLILCQAFKRLIDDGEDVVLLIYGSVEDIAIYNQISVYFSDRIKYLGESNDVPTLMSHSDAFVLPSIWEGMPITLLEALSVGCIPICSPVGGIVNVITDGVNGILSETPSESEFYNALKRFTKMTETEIEKIQIAAESSFDKFTIQKSANNYLKAYSEA